MKNSVIPEKLTVTDYFAVNIFNSLMNNAGYQVIDKKSIIKESYELAAYMTELKNKGENKNE